MVSKSDLQYQIQAESLDLAKATYGDGYSFLTRSCFVSGTRASTLFKISRTTDQSYRLTNPAESSATEGSCINREWPSRFRPLYHIWTVSNAYQPLTILIVIIWQTGYGEDHHDRRGY